MEQTKLNNEEIISIDFKKLSKYLMKNIKKIIASGIVFGVLLGACTVLFMDKKYASEERIYLKPNVTENGVVDFNQLNSNSIMVNNFVSMLKGNNLSEKVASELNIENSLVKKSLNITHEENTEIISVKATTTSPELSKQIVETTVNLFFDDVRKNLDIKNMTIIDKPDVNNKPVSPNLKLNIILGVILGALITVVILIIKYLQDKRLKSAKDVEEYLEITVLAEIPKYEE